MVTLFCRLALYCVQTNSRGDNDIMRIPAKNTLTGKVRLINLSDIMFLERVKAKVLITTKDSEYTPLKSLSDFGELLRRKGFKTLDKSNLVNVKNIDEFIESESSVKMTNGSFAYVSRRNRRRLWGLLKL